MPSAVPSRWQGLNHLKEKMTQGWVVYGGMRHAEPQREMFPRSYSFEMLNEF
jgi:hypothetical protein